MTLNLSKEQSDQLTRELATIGIDWNGDSAIPHADRRSGIELSFSQEHLWFLQQLDPSDSSYNIIGRVRFMGEANIPKLVNALDQVIRRHETLRTSFGTEGGKPKQNIHSEVEWTFNVIDLALEQNQRLEFEIVREITHRPFDLETAPLLKVFLLRTTEERELLLIVLHHIVADGWSMGLLLTEVTAFYSAAHQHVEPLPSLPIQYADYSAWQRNRLQGKALDDGLAFWKRELTDVPQILELPSDHPRPAVQTHAGDTFHWSIDFVQHRALRAFCERGHFTSFMLYYAVWASLIARLANVEQLVIGVPIANRPHADTESVIGFFVNTLPFVSTFSGNPTFTEFLGRTQTRSLAAQAYQQIPFETIVDALQIERHPAYSPLFQVMFSFQNAPQGSAQTTELEVVYENSIGAGSKYDLTLTVAEEGECIGLYLEYNTDLFEQRTIAGIADRYTTLLAALNRNRDIRFGDLPVFTQGEIGEELAASRGLPAVVRGDILTMFASAVGSYPDSPAAEDRTRTLTYRDVDEASDKVAQFLRSRGVGPEVPVGVFMERSLEMLPVILGIIKAGGTYVPLDPRYPVDRISLIIDDCRMALAFTGPETNKLLNHLVEVVVITSDWFDSETNGSSVIPHLLPGSLLYVVYTSGSTGRPKGVSFGHQAFYNLIAYVTRTMATRPRTLQFSSIGFDASIHELFMTWCAGGTAIICSSDDQRDFAALAALVHAKQVTRLNLPAAVIEPLLCEIYKQGAPDSVIEIISTAEQLIVGPQLREWMSRGAHFAWNHYGPSETHVITALPILGRWMNSVTPPIGKAIDNCETYILDNHLNVLPMGTVGELYLGGIGLARGYNCRPDQTADRFIPNPFGIPGSRLYRTGDRARRLENGEIEYLGRLDTQIKLRGFRIELGEIEGTILSAGGISDVTVVIQGDTPADKRLIAYVVGSISAEHLRHYLLNKLPTYMVPSFFIFLPALPLTVNGKLDKRALPPPTYPVSISTDQFATLRQQLIRDSWRSVLGLARIGMDDNFFDSGGNSLLAAQVTIRLREALQFPIPVRLIFDQPTIRRLDMALSLQLEDDSVSCLPAPVRHKDRDSYPLSFAQERLWFLAQLDPHNPSYNMPFAFRIAGKLDIPALLKAFHRILRQHEILRSIFIECDGVAQQVILDAPTANIAFVDLERTSLRESKAIPQVLSRCASHVFDLRSDISIRLHIFRFSDLDHIAMILLHHIAADAWSLSLLAEELLQSSDNSNSSGESKFFPPAHFQYGDYAIWQRSLTSGEWMDVHLNFWKTYLANLPERTPLPYDFPPSEMSLSTSVVHRWHFSGHLAEGIHALCRNHNTTAFMVFLTAWSLVLSRWTVQSDVLIGVPISTRDVSSFERLIGLFTNTLALRVRLRGSQPFSSLLKSVTRSTLECFEHRQFPFEALVAEMQPDRAAEATPIFQTMFAFQNVPKTSIALPDAEIQPIDIPPVRPKFDLMLAGGEHGGLYEMAIEYDGGRFTSETISMLAEGLTQTLAICVQTPGILIGDIDTLSEPAKLRIQRGSLGTRPTIRTSLTILGVVERAAISHPDAPALISASTSYSFSALSRCARALAAELRERNIGVESRVAIYLPRSPSQVISLLAVLYAGGTYIPIDAAYPQERVRRILNVAKPQLVLTDPEHVPTVEGYGHITLTEEKLSNFRSAQPDLPSLERKPTQATYIVFTSGSTGTPKGVTQTDGALCNLLTWCEHIWLHSKRMIQFASIGFDVSFQEIFGTWTTGGAVVLIDEETRRDLQLLIDTIITHSANRVMLPASLIGDFIDEFERNGAPSTLHELVSTGEQLYLTRSMHARLECLGLSLQNHYGPTETHVVAMYESHPLDESSDPRVPIGFPIDNCAVYILDDELRQVPPGTTAELYLGGASVARGYFGQPAETAERFLPDPFQGGGGRVYRTGDLGRLDHHGHLVYLGRIDDQVKIRGHRVELSEIQAVAYEFRGVKQCLAVFKTTPPFQGRILLYYVGTPTPESLLEHLRRVLPEVMLPLACIALSSFPTNANGKVDRTLLPAPELANSHGANFTPVQDVIANIWSDLLQSPITSPDVNFFQIGGHSLLATRVVARVRSHLRKNVSVKDLFETQTLRRFTELLIKLDAHSSAVPIPLLSRAENCQIYPVSYAQESIWLADQLKPSDPAYNIGFLLQISDRVDLPRLRTALDVLISRHTALRTKLAYSDETAIQVVLEDPGAPLHVADLALLSASAQDSVMLKLSQQEAKRGFNLYEGPCCRMALVPLGQEKSILHFSMHHAFADGWSMEIVRQELAESYSLPHNHVLSNEVRPVQFGEYCLWQRSVEMRQHIEDSLPFWRSYLENPPYTSIVSSSGPFHSRGSASVVDIPVGIGVYSKMKAICEKHATSLFMFLSATLGVLLMQRTASRDLIFGTDVSVRSLLEFESTVGLLLNQLPIRLRIAQETTFEDMLALSRESIWRAYAHKDVPFEELARLHPSMRTAGRHPLFSIKLTFQNTPRRTAYGDLHWSAISSSLPDRKMDVTLFFQEREGVLEGKLHYDSSRCDKEEMAVCARAYSNLLAQFSHRPNLTID